MKTLASTAQSALLIAISTFFIGQFLASLPAEICLLPMLGSHICVKLPLNVPVETLNNTTPNIWTGAQLPQSNPTRPGSLPASILKKQPTYLRLDTPQEAVQVFGLVKLGIATDGIASNPFDPAQIDIQVHFISSHGTQQTATAFWYQDFDPVTLKPRGEPGWQVRFTPDSSGVWIVQAEIADPSLKSLPVEVKVNSSLETRGFVRTNKENPHYLAFDDGSLYFPIGMNIAWATSLNETLTDYQHWFDKLSANGGNFARVWMSSWDLGIEWNDTGLGDYTNRLKQAWLLDQVFEMAGQRGIYIMLTLLNHGSFSRTVDPEWSDNPYNARLGGPLSKPQDFVTDPQSIDLFKRRLSYIVARYGYSPNLMAWEWWNEVDRTPIRSDTLEPWLDEMDSYLKTIDPYQHLTTNSYSTGVSSLWSIPGLNIVQQHDYSDSDPMTSFGSIYNQLSRSGPGKPVMLGEYGSLTNSTDPLIDADPVHMHNGLWAAAFTGFAGTGMYWWWDKLVDPLDLWGQFKGISVFLKGEALPLLKPGKALVLPWKARALTMQNTNRLLAWIRSDAYTINNAQKAYTQAIQSGKDSGSWDYEPAQLSGLTITVTGLANGNYTAAWFDPETAEWMPETR